MVTVKKDLIFAPYGDGTDDDVIKVFNIYLKKGYLDNYNLEQSFVDECCNILSKYIHLSVDCSRFIGSTVYNFSLFGVSVDISKPIDYSILNDDLKFYFNILEFLNSEDDLIVTIKKNLKELDLYVGNYYVLFIYLLKGGSLKYI